MSGVRKPHAVSVLAFDFGEKYIGVAVGDTETGTASPKAVIVMRKSRRILITVKAEQSRGQWLR